MENVLELFPEEGRPEPGASLEQRLAALMDQRLRLESRLIELERVRTVFAATRLEPALMGAAAKLDEQIREMDRDLTHLADAIHELRVELESRALIAADAAGVLAVLFVSAGGQRFAVPLAQVHEVREQDAAAPQRMDTLMGLSPAESKRKLRVLAGDGFAIAVDEVERQDEVRVLPLSAALAGMRIYLGAALTPGDVLVPVVNLRELTRRPA